MKRLTQQRKITILRDDHIGDPLGAIFLDQTVESEDRIMELLRDYLGSRVRILRVDLTRDKIEVILEIQAMTDEAQRLAAAAENLKIKGAPRNALDLFREALVLDPLNQVATTGIGVLLADLGRHDEAFAILKRAREYGPENADLLYALGQVALVLDRTVSAIVYLERAFQLAPSHFGARRVLTDLGRKPKPPARTQPLASRPTKSAVDSKHS
jgi:tetratricopeptide (TPR) repeat protein